MKVGPQVSPLDLSDNSIHDGIRLNGRTAAGFQLLRGASSRQLAVRGAYAVLMRAPGMPRARDVVHSHVMKLLGGNPCAMSIDDR